MSGVRVRHMGLADTSHVLHTFREKTLIRPHVRTGLDKEARVKQSRLFHYHLKYITEYRVGRGKFLLDV